MARATKAAARAATIQRPPVESPKATTGTVSVACKLPSGLILRLFKMVDGQETAPGGYRAVKKAEQLPGEVQINGNSVAWGVVPAHRIIGGYGITEHVPAEFFEKWLEQNADHPAVVNNLVFAVNKGDEYAPTEERKKVLSGLEPLSPEKDPRAPAKIKTADVTKQAS